MNALFSGKKAAWRKVSIVPSFSGGKDSTYLVLRLHELGIKMADIVYFDTGWEFPHMEAHISQVEDIIKQRITRLVPREDFDFLFARKARTRNAKSTRKGYGWPSAMRRWCTGEKQRAINAYANSLTWQGIALPVIQCLGYASDEASRVEKHKARKVPRFQGYAYPMVEWGVSESHALEYCRERGLAWDGLYDIFDRVSCWCCPLGGITHARKYTTVSLCSGTVCLKWNHGFRNNTGSMPGKIPFLTWTDVFTKKILLLSLTLLRATRPSTAPHDGPFKETSCARNCLFSNPPAK